MSEELVVRHCSPTLAGLKTGNMFTAEFSDKDDLRCELCRLNRIFVKKGLRAIPLRYKDDRALIYIYRPTRLKDDLNSSDACRVLESCGYSCNSAGKCIGRLIERLRNSDEFPHEIGLFLGYPPEDVTGFIEKRSCKLTGFWKVYGDPGSAEKRFASFRKCMKVYYDRWSEGCSLESLAVATV
ncbi:MAG: DUF3793 family protein [Ruminococcus sp.]|nr:DUF3793 family protein [Ruminococcus sp.]